MIAVEGYFDGTVIRTLQKLNAKKNQRVIITVLDEEIRSEEKRVKTEAAGFLAKHANPELINMEEGAWEREAVKSYENT